VAGASSEGYGAPLLVVLSGPSGVGKDTVLLQMKKQGCSFHYVITATTRPRRGKEKEDIDYHFLSEDKFRQMIDDGEFLEWANVYGNFYGVPKKEMRQAMDRGMDVIVKVDVQGVATIKKKIPQAISIFIKPPSIEGLERRLKGRHSEKPADLALRLGKAHEEMKALSKFDYVLTSHHGKVGEVIAQIEAIVTEEKQQARPKIINI
jgi:guanylate kinase